MKTQRDSVQGRWKSRSGWLEGVEGQINQTQYAHTEFEASVPATRFERSGSDGRLQLDHRPIGSLAGLRGSMGLQWESSRFASSGSEAYLPNDTRSQWALFAYEALPTNWGKLDMGLRAEELRLTSLGNAAVPALNASIGGYRYHPHSLAVGAQGQINAQWAWHLHGSSNQRAPGDNELFAHGAHVATRAYELGDPGLGLEKSNSLESGLEWQKDAHRWGLNAWLTRFSNYLSLEDTGLRVSDQGVAENLSTPGFTTGGDVADWHQYAYRQVRARFMGVEMNGRQRWLDQGFSLDWEYRLDVLRATNDTTAQPLPRISPVRWGSALAWAQGGKGGWTGRFGFDHYARQTHQPVGQISTGGYTLWNAYASYRYKLTPTQVLDWFVKLDNLADVKAFSATSVLTQTAAGKAPLPGRSIKLGVQWGF